MNSFFRQCPGFLKDTGTSKGLGVFAERHISSNEVVEIAPVIQIEVDYNELAEQLQRRVFHWERLAGRAGVHALALGYGSMYNHDNPANMRYYSDIDGTAIRFVAARDIEVGEELTINYNDTGGETVSIEDNWFELVGVKIESAKT
mgnify:FL=1